ncbi:MAG: DUF3810 domain-containing protein [Clostridia bacterium]|nr:DUF3810 domain-containing protein [Clostridia bacterium]
MSQKFRLKDYVPTWVVVSAVLFGVCTVLTLISRVSVPLADFINSFVATPLRAFFAALTYILPFSLFELILILLLPALALLIFILVKRAGDLASMIRGALSVVGVILILISWYDIVMAIPYNVTPLADRLGIEEKKDISKDELYSVTLEVLERVNELSPLVDREDGIGDIGLTDHELSVQISRAYEDLRDHYPFYFSFASRHKPIFFSGIMTDMGITGIYTYFTGEANVNTLYPDYDYAFTVAHEFAHQRGINRENEANFMAFLVLSHSESTFLQYSAYLNLFQYLASAIYSTDKELYRELYASLDEGAISDVRRSNEITREHMDSPLYKLMNSVNDAYLKSNGTEGVVSYGYVVRLAVAYFNKN